MINNRKPIQRLPVNALNDADWYAPEQLANKLNELVDAHNAQFETLDESPKPEELGRVAGNASFLDLRMEVQDNIYSNYKQLQEENARLHEAIDKALKKLTAKPPVSHLEKIHDTIEILNGAKEKGESK